MLHEEPSKKREQISLVCIDELVPQNHLLRKIDRVIDWSFIYDLVKEKYSPDFGRPSIDPVILIKIVLIQYLYGIRSMRQTIREIEVNLAYRWFLGLGMYEKVPHFSTFGKNYTRRFKGTDLFEQIFSKILQTCIDAGLVDPSEVFIDATHVKACANSNKLQQKVVQEEALFYEEQLKKEINEDRIAHGKKPLKDKENDDDDDLSGESGSKPEKEIKVSTTDPDSGWFHKGKHKQVFAYSIETACDKHGWILGFTVNRGNEHDSRTFKGIYDKIKNPELKTVILDAGYKTPAIAKLLLDDEVQPLFPYKRPMTKDGFFRKYEYVYDEYYDCYIESCPYLSQCTESKNHVKVIARHIWESYMEQAEDIRYTLGMKDLYDQRKETIERIFGSAKEYHGFRYTNMIGKARMSMKAALTFTCINLKKLAKIKGGNPSLSGCLWHFPQLLRCLFGIHNKMAPAIAC